PQASNPGETQGLRLVGSGRESSGEGWVTGFEPATFRSTVGRSLSPSQGRESTSAATVTPLTTTSPDDPSLAQVVAAWPTLPEHVRLAVLALVRSTQPGT